MGSWPGKNGDVESSSILERIVSASDALDILDIMDRKLLEAERSMLEMFQPQTIPTASVFGETRSPLLDTFTYF